MDPVLVAAWVAIATSIIGTGVNIGIYRQAQREHGRRITTLEEEKLDIPVFDATIRRLDSRDDAHGQHLMNLQGRVDRISQRRS